MATALSVVYASAPASEILIPTLEVQVSGHDPIRVCADYDDHQFGVGGQLVTFIGGNLEVSIPSVGTNGQQSLTFGVWNVNGDVRRYVRDALESGERVPVIYREYLMSDPSAPAREPRPMVLIGGEFEGVGVQFEASYYDLLNAAWPKDRYTVDAAPGLKYL